jgi:hypothetical protein
VTVVNNFTVIPGRAKRESGISCHQLRDSPMRNCASEVCAFGASGNDG